MRKRKKVIGSLIILLLVVICLVVGYVVSKPKVEIKESDLFVESTPVINNEVKNITVEIKGMVKQPGVYTLNPGSRVEDLIKKSGGFLEDADTDSIVLVKKLKEEDCIIVKQKGDTNNTINNEMNVLSNGKIDINTATKEQLDSISGVGPVTAQKILEYRSKNGRFQSLEDLKKIGGIGDKTLNKFKDKIDVR